MSSASSAISVILRREGSRRIGSIGVGRSGLGLGGGGGGGGGRGGRSSSSKTSKESKESKNVVGRCGGRDDSGEVCTCSSSPPTPPAEIKVHATRA